MTVVAATLDDEGRSLTSDGAVIVSVVNGGGAMEALRGEWTDLLLGTPRPSVFLSWEWMTTWLHEFNPARMSPKVLLVRRADGTLVGLAPLCESAPRGPLMVRTLSFMGTGVGADHLAVLARTGAEVQTRAAVAGWLWADRRWDILDLPRLDDDTAQWLERAAGAFDRELASVSRTADICPFITLPGSWEDFLRALRSDARKDLGRRWRRLREQGDVSIEQVQEPVQLEPAWRVLLRLHDERRQVAGGRSAFTAPRSLAFHRAFLERAAERGWLRLYLMRVADHYVAAEYCLSLGGRVVDLQTGFDAGWSRFGVSTLLLGHAIQQAIAEGATEFDFLRGGETYKQQRWAAALRRDTTLVVWRRRPRVRAMMAARRWAESAKSAIRLRWPGRRASDVAHTTDQAAEG